jgi:hypothetical protein
MQVTTGTIMGVSDLGQVQDVKGNLLRWRQEGEAYIAKGVNTDGYSWEYIASIIRINPTIVSITVKKTKLY